MSLSLEESARQKQTQAHFEAQKNTGEVQALNAEIGDIFGELSTLGVDISEFDLNPAEAEELELSAAEEALVHQRRKQLLGTWRKYKQRAKLIDSLHAYTEKGRQAPSLTGKLEEIAQKKSGGDEKDYSTQVLALKKMIAKLEAEIESEIDTEYVFHYAYLYKRLKDYKRQARTQGIIETPYVATQKEAVTKALRDGQNIFMHGAFGTGKTDIAILAATEYTAEKVKREKTEIETLLRGLFKKLPKLTRENVSKIQRQLAAKPEGKFERYRQAAGRYLELLDLNPAPLVLSGYKDMESFEMFGQPNLKSEAVTNEVTGEITMMQVTEFDLGAVYQALEQGRVLVIDEMNTIPQRLLSRLNYILEQGRKEGAVVNVQEDNGRTIVSKGIRVIATGNLPDETGRNQIVGRADLDAATLSRFGKKIEHGFLPQSTLGEREDGVVDRHGNELFEVLMARVTDSKGYARLSTEAVEDLWKFTAFAATIQNIYSGQSQEKVNIDGHDVSAAEQLKGYSVSWREINAIMNEWVASSHTERLSGLLYEYIDSIPAPRAKDTFEQLLEVNIGLERQTGSYSESTILEYGPKEILDLVYGEAPEASAVELPDLETAPQLAPESDAEGGIDLEVENLELSELEGQILNLLERETEVINQMERDVDDLCGSSTSPII